MQDALHIPELLVDTGTGTWMLHPSAAVFGLETKLCFFPLGKLACCTRSVTYLYLRGLLQTKISTIAISDITLITGGVIGERFVAKHVVSLDCGVKPLNFGGGSRFLTGFRSEMQVQAFGRDVSFHTCSLVDDRRSPRHEFSW